MPDAGADARMTRPPGVARLNSSRRSADTPNTVTSAPGFALS